MVRTDSSRSLDGRPWIVLCAANNWDDVRLSDRPLAEALCRYVNVLYVDPPLSRLAPRNNPRLAPSLEGPRLRKQGAGMWRLTPVVLPFPFRPGMTPISRFLVRRSLRGALRRLAVRPEAVVSTLPLIPVFDLVPGSLHAYWSQDDIVAGAALWGMDVDRLVEGENGIIAAADQVLYASPEAADRAQAQGVPARVFPNGCDVDRFDAPVVWQREVAAGPVAGFVGHLNRRTDLDLLEAVADQPITLLLVGPIGQDVDRTRLDALLTRPNVSAVGAKPFEELPDWLGRMDVGLVPYAVDEFNRWSFPLKTLEYLAAGLPVVSTNLPASRWLGSDHIVLADSSVDFAQAVLKSAELPKLDEIVQERRQFARKHSWDERAKMLLKSLQMADAET